MIERVADASYRHRRVTTILWLVALVAIGALSAQFAGEWKTDFRLPGTDSQRAQELLTKYSVDGQTRGEEGRVVLKVQGPDGLAQPQTKETIAKINELLLANKFIDATSIVDPYSPQGAATQVATLQDQSQIAFIGFSFREVTPAESVEQVESSLELRDQILALATDEIQIEMSGRLFTEFELPPSELFGLLAAVIILVIAFGSLVAAGLPIVTALFGIAIGVSIVKLFTNLFNIPDFTLQISLMIGLGVGIDYALFIVTRYRTALQGGKDPEASVAEAMGTAGRAVVFAGCTVIISLMGMFAMGVPFVYGLAIGASITVLISVLAALTLLPALLGFIGRNIDRGTIHRNALVITDKESFWHRWSTMLMRRPWIGAISGLVILLTLAAPVLSIRLGNADAGANKSDQTTRRAYDLLSQGFGPGFNGPFFVVAEVKNEAGLEAFDNTIVVISQTPGVASAINPRQLQAIDPFVPGPDGEMPNQIDDPSINPPPVVEQTFPFLASAIVYPTTSPQSVETQNLIHTLRDDVIPAAQPNRDDVITYLTGEAVINVEFSEVLGSRLPIFLLVVLGLSFLLLMAVFRSLLVPLKAVIMNLLSIGATYGVLVAIFQWGWFKGLIGLETLAPISPWAPMMLFAIVFGLSMDYEVFLLSRIREEYVRTKDNNYAVVEGLASTARVITAAAAIMCCVFFAFVFGDLRDIKLFGLGLGVAVLLDATVVRMVLVPSTMALLGDANWWFPSWLDRITPRLHVEGKPVEEEATAAEAQSEPDVTRNSTPV